MKKRLAPLQLTLRLLTLGIVAVVLNSCGFQLRDSYQLPAQLESVYIQAEPFSEFAEILASRLQLAGAQLDEQPRQTVIQIVSDSLDRRTLSLSSSGQVAEYELIYSVEYVLHNGPSSSVPLQVEVFRDYQDDPNFALAKTREREVLVTEMREDAARQILRQISAQLTR
ncbi:MAG TPA: LPS assembly lipoprotein LptE [Pseudidiomarina sp.]|nr:LPS assembly lipoprotein LptE [Pseudidiomarina sp.]